MVLKRISSICLVEGLMELRAIVNSLFVSVVGVTKVSLCSRCIFDYDAVPTESRNEPVNEGASF